MIEITKIQVKVFQNRTLHSFFFFLSLFYFIFCGGLGGQGIGHLTVHVKKAKSITRSLYTKSFTSMVPSKYARVIYTKSSLRI